MNRIVIAVALCLSTILTSCVRPEPPQPLTPVIILDGGEPATCAKACDRMAAFNCSESRPTSKGQTCQAVCETAPAYAALPVACVVQSTTMQALQACGVCVK